MGEPIYEPNSFTAVLSRLDTSVAACVASVDALKNEFQSAHVRLHERLDEHEQDLRALKTAEAVRKKEVKWAVAIVAMVGWGINAVISWYRGV
jgi:hypothetical protein